ncbi:hypothetical protein KZZ52_42185 [Dactylosporangium sp. AC04546]|uniref:hypothetical protein n=1 Tax=Dactylosporangium sp. AC04546 TaxID=2862460 RepID=UPI002E7BA3B9|nr:hypothetical protein [Dactylosporangium sp. AC04546]WVK80529.1 hypothetical protein KZZ52_42185 [Dactylosporangium sp. AC04546]
MTTGTMCDGIRMKFDPDAMEVYAEPLAELVPGERVLAAVVTNAPMGLDPPLPPGGGGQAYTTGSVAGGILGPVISPPKPGQGFFWWLVFGRSAAGTATSVAAESRRACLGHNPLLLVVTDARLRLFEPRDAAYFIDDPDKRRMPTADRLRPLWDTPVSNVRSARVGRYRLNWCRLTIEFTDGSWVAFANLFHMGRRKGRTVAVALAHLSA